MPAAPPDSSASLAIALLGLLGLVLIAGTLAAWAGVLRRLWTRQPLWRPAAGPRVVSWHGGSILGVILLYAIIATVVGSASRLLTPPAPVPAATPTIAKTEPKPELSPRQRLALQAVINVAALAAVPWFLRRTTRTTWADLGLSPRDCLANLQRGALAFFLVGLPVYGSMRLALAIWPRQQHPVEMMLQERIDPATALLALVSAVILAPVVEELLFRGLLMGWLQRLFDPSSVASLPEPFPEPTSEPETRQNIPPPRGSRYLPDGITAGLFAAMHLSQWPAPLPLFLLALALGALMRRTGSLWAPIGLHAAFNAVSTLGMLLGSAAGARIDESPPAWIAPPAQAGFPVDSLAVYGVWANSAAIPIHCQGIAEKNVENVLGDRPELNYDSAVIREPYSGAIGWPLPPHSRRAGNRGLPPSWSEAAAQGGR